MAKLQLQGTFRNEKGGFEIGLSLLSYEDEGHHVIYSPSLDIFGYGANEKEAKASFQEALNEFLQYTTNKGTLHEELKHLGWKVSGSKKKRKLSPPDLNKLLRDNEQLFDIVNNKEFHKYHEKVNLPELVC